MDASVNGMIRNFEIAWRNVEHNGVDMTRQEVWNVLQYAKEKGYRYISNLSDEEINREKNINKPFVK